MKACKAWTSVFVVLMALWLVPSAFARTTRRVVVKTRALVAARTPAQAPARVAPGRAGARRYATSIRSRRFIPSPWKEPTFADSAEGDRVEGEDPVVRHAAVEALGPYNGTIVVADPHTGRILTVVNQKLALKSGFIPCSTIKLVTGLAALSEGLIERDTTPIRLSRYQSMDLTKALAISNNPYFAILGEKLGFERVSYYGRLFGLGERAGLNIADEQPGIMPTAPPPEGVGMMTSFGSGIALTPLGLTALVSAIANEGTLYYLQYPRSQADVTNFVPRVKRHLDIQRFIPEMKPGMMGAVEYGTGRRAGYSYEDTILGKTGTCTDERTPTHLGWFGSYNDVGRNKLVVTVLLTGGRPVNGPVASGVAGAVYRNLAKVDYFAQSRPISPAAMVANSCCLR